jgi:ATP-binding cassette, subfamily B (MDR/TAP), member 1
VQGHAFGVVGCNLAERLRQRFLCAALHMEAAWYDVDEHTSGALAARLANDAPAVRGAIADTLAAVVQSAVTLAVGYGIALATSWKVALVITAVMPLLLLNMVVQSLRWAGACPRAPCVPLTQAAMHAAYARCHAGHSVNDEAMFGRASQVAVESVQALRTVHAYNLQEAVLALYRSLLQEPQHRMARNALASGLSIGVGQMAQLGTYGLAFWYGGTLVAAEEMDLERMVRVFFAAVFALGSIMQTQLVFPDIKKGHAAVGSIFGGAWCAGCLPEHLACMRPLRARAPRLRDSVQPRTMHAEIHHHACSDQPPVAHRCQQA